MSRLKNQADTLKASVTVGGRIHESVRSAIDLISQLAGKMDAEDRELALLRREIEELKSWKQSHEAIEAESASVS